VHLPIPFIGLGEYITVTLNEDEKGMTLKRLPFQQIASKWLKTYIMSQDDELSRYLPQTARWHPNVLFKMLKQFGSVYLKPDKGGGGAGIIRVKLTDSHRYEVRYGIRRQVIVGETTLISYLRRRMQPHKRYLIQQGIRLAHVDGRPFDIRVVLQKPRDQWIVMGMAAKVAAKKKIVTNRANGGIAATVPKVLQAGFGWRDEHVRLVEHVLSRIALRTAAVLSTRFPGLRVLGLDVGIDVRGNVWIFEVNTRPQFRLFQQTDPVRYRQIVRNQRQIVADGRKRLN
jgi:glutathione synthase/RimK-type ligase-like ATP-grasp enzyme